MSMKIIVYILGTHYRAKNIGMAMYNGLKAYGADIEKRQSFNGVEGDVAVAYGWNHEPVFTAYGKYLYCDLGYWNRRPNKRPKEGHHRVSANAWCPTVNMRRDRPTDRLDRANLRIAKNTNGNNGILLAAMSEKSARTHGFPFETWDRSILTLLRTNTIRPIHYRPKPKKYEIAPSIEEALSLCSSVVTYCSNVAVDGVIAGCSVYAERGIGKLVSVDSLTDIISAEPKTYEERVSFLSDVAYCQWTPDEMRSGAMWDYMKGLV
jgi:hypothetical protein